jgi:hypothetical protein
MSQEQRDEPVSREELRSLLDRWQTGAINERTVHETAEELWARYGEAPVYPKEDPRSIALEVVSQLEVLNYQLITPVDVPAFLEFLGAPAGRELAAWERWTSYWDGIDYQRRAVELADKSYYAPLRSGQRKSRSS